MSKVHRVRSDSEPFEAAWSGVKKAEVRVDDRGYEAGDEMVMMEQDQNQEVTGRSIVAAITHVQRGYGLPDPIVVLSFETLARMDSRKVTPNYAKSMNLTSVVPSGGLVRWSRFVSDEHGLFSNGAFFYNDVRFEVVRKQEVTSKPAPAAVQRTLMRDLDGRLISLQFEPDVAVDETLNFMTIIEQARAWEEVAHTIHEMDPNWHRNGRPVDSAVKFIRRTEERDIYAAAFRKMAEQAAADAALRGEVIKTARSATMSPLFAAPYGEPRPATYSKEPGGHPADIEGDQS